VSDRRSEVHIISKTQWATPQRGTFWVAGADDRVHGALSGPGSESLVVDSPLLLPDLPEATGGVISLTGELDEMVLDLVHGVLHDGTEVTLVRLRRYTWLLEAFADKSSQQQWEARAVVTGAHLSSDEAHRIRTLSVETDYSLDWSQAGAPGANATQHVMAEGESDLGQVKVIDATDTQRSIASASFTRRAWIEVDFRDPVDVETVVATIAQDLLSLVSFAVGKPDRVVYIGAVIDDLSAPVEIHVDYLEHGDDRDESRVHVSRQVLPLDEVPAGVGELLDAWLSLSTVIWNSPLTVNRAHRWRT